MDAVPIWILFILTVIAVVIAIGAGRRLGGTVRRRSAEEEKESSVSAIVGTILGLVAFILAFTFGIVSSRFDARKALVLEEANAIGTAYLRTDFMSQPDRSKTRELFHQYLESRIAAVESRDIGKFRKSLIDSQRIQGQLWDMAVVNAFKDMNSDVAALYIDSLNTMFDIHSSRLTIGSQTRIPLGIWLVLYILIMLGMVSVGYQIAIAGSSKRSWVTLLMAFSFSLVITLIASLDRPQSGFITVSQQPLIDLCVSMNAGL